MVLNLFKDNDKQEYYYNKNVNPRKLEYKNEDIRN